MNEWIADQSVLFWKQSSDKKSVPPSWLWWDNSAPFKERDAARSIHSKGSKYVSSNFLVFVESPHHFKNGSQSEEHHLSKIPLKSKLKSKFTILHDNTWLGYPRSWAATSLCNI